MDTIIVNIGANEASATICWTYEIPITSNCVVCNDKKTLCQTVYVGVNECDENGESSPRKITGSFEWNGQTINYEIHQDAAICSDCGKEISACTDINYWVSPYVITPDMDSTTLYWDYWFTDEFENIECDIIREKKLASKTIPISKEDKNKDCDDLDRIVSKKDIQIETACGNKNVDIEYFIQKPDVCCDLSGDCYEINEIVYNPTSVPSEGGLVKFSFDYKRIEIDENCEPKETYGTYFGEWKVPECKGDECCFTKPVTSSFTWNDICGRGTVSGCNIISESEYDDGDIVYIPNSAFTNDDELDIPFSAETIDDKNTIYLSILREKSFSADCEVHCDFDTVYCVDKPTVTTEYYDYDTSSWVVLTSGVTEDNEPITTVNSYAYPYYGGRFRVSWEYYIITIYEDCSVGISKGNKYVDELSVQELDNCKDHEDTCNITLGVNYNGCTITIDVEGFSNGNKSSRENNDTCPIIKASGKACTDTGGEITIGVARKIDIPYIFKKGLCELPSNQLSAVISNLPEGILPDNICPSKDEKDKPKCNEFTVTLYQFEKDCNPDCVPCLDNYMINVGSAATSVERHYRSDCNFNFDLTEYGDGETTMQGGKLVYKNDCSSWVSAITNSDFSITFKIEENKGTYRRGKVIFTHDNKCKEEVIINQDGSIDKSSEYKPDPGYCSLELELNKECVGYNGDIITITPSTNEKG